MRINPARKQEGILVPRWLLKRSASEICAGTKLCYAQLISHGRSGQCFPRLQILANELGVTRKQAQRYIKNLADLKLIELKLNPGHSSNYYILVHKWMLEECADIQSAKEIPFGQPSLDKLFKDGLGMQLDHPLTWNVWRQILRFDRENLSIRKLKEKVRDRYDYFIGQIAKGKKLKIP